MRVLPLASTGTVVSSAWMRFVHLSGVGNHAIDGIGDVADTGGFADGLGIGGLLGLLDFDNA